jgi:uncharacterized protein (TIGR02679 family)
VTERKSLLDPALTPLWEAVRKRLERSAVDNRGRLTVPPLTAQGRWLMTSAMDGRVSATISLRQLEERLVALGVGTDLTSALAILGFPVSDEPARRRASLEAGRETRAAIREIVSSWPEPWAKEWIDSLIRSGVFARMEQSRALQLVTDGRAVLDAIAANAGAADSLSRVDLAASVLGSAHALDWGTEVEVALTRALEYRSGESKRAAWESAGVQLDLVSAPVLTWSLPVTSGSSLSGLVSEATGLGSPLHLSQLLLRKAPAVVERGVPVLVTENPRVVEAASAAGFRGGVVSLNGNPAGAARLLVEQLLDCGAELLYHGDFDAAGLRICARMHRLGLTPWRMDGGSYLQALDDARKAGTTLPVDPYRAPPTPWDPTLQETFDVERRIVHEERLLSILLKERAVS